jgi:membrane protein
LLSEAVVRFALQGTSLLLTLCIFLLIYRFMPNTKTYWRYIWPGAIVAAVLFESAKNLFLTYVDQFANFENVYGSLAPVIALLLWAYVSSFILILGAELSSEYGRLRRGVGRGVLLHPREESGRE